MDVVEPRRAGRSAVAPGAEPGPRRPPAGRLHGRGPQALTFTEAVYHHAHIEFTNWSTPKYLTGRCHRDTVLANAVGRTRRSRIGCAKDNAPGGMPKQRRTWGLPK